MNCHVAETQMHAARDGALDPSSRAALDAHLAGCPACRQVRSSLEASADAWRTQVAAVALPDVEREWHAIRRRIRTEGAPERARPHERRPWWSPVAFPASVLAVLCIAFLVSPWGGIVRDTDDASPARFAQAEMVEFGDPALTPLVFVDEKTGWLVVWATPELARAGS